MSRIPEKFSDGKKSISGLTAKELEKYFTDIFLIKDEGRAVTFTYGCKEYSKFREFTAHTPDHCDKCHLHKNCFANNFATFSKSFMKIEKITPQVVEFYGPDDRLIDDSVNEYEFNSILITFKDFFVPGYYFLYNNERINIIEGGRIDKQPKGFFDLIQNQMKIILGF